jgi:hypothetical protein
MWNINNTSNTYNINNNNNTGCIGNIQAAIVPKGNPALLFLYPLSKDVQMTLLAIQRWLTFSGCGQGINQPS